MCFTRLKKNVSSLHSAPLLPLARLAATVPASRPFPSTQTLPQSQANPSIRGSTSPTVPHTPQTPTPPPGPQSSPTTLSLWDQAVAKLDPEFLKFIGPQQARFQIVEELFQETEKIKAKQEDAERSYQNRFGETKSVRESVGTFLANFKKFIPLGDQVVSQAPAIISLGWGGFKVLLQALTASVENLTIIFESFDNISRILSHCRIYEDLYAQMNLKAGSLLKNALVMLYISVLEYLCYVKRHLARDTAAQYMERALDSVWMGLNGRLDNVTKREVELMKEADLAAKEDHNTRLKCLLEMCQPILEIEHTVADMFTIIGEIQRDKILLWLSDVKFFDHHSSFSTNRRATTGEWLVKRKGFLDWKISEKSSILWLHGIAGSGKTMLISRVIDYFKDEAELNTSNPSTLFLDSPEMEPKQPALVYFYCNYKGDDRNEPAPILRTLVKQFCMMAPEGKFLTSISSIYEKRKDSGQLTIKECSDILVQFIARYSQTTIVIDALDECKRNTRKSLLDALKSLLALPDRVKIIIASRDDDDLTRTFAQYSDFRIEVNNSKDIELFINSQIEDRIKHQELLGGEVGMELKKLIVSTLQDKACGMFLWVHFQILQICQQVTPSGIIRTLSMLPSDLNKTYSAIMEKIKPIEPAGELAEKALKWLLFAVRPLSPTELIMAISVDPMTRNTDTEGLTVERILGICQNLVVFDKKLDVLRFAHFSVQEFLLPRFEPNEWHRDAAEVCLTSLLDQDTVTRSTLMDYSTFYWPVHVEMAVGESMVLSKLWKEFLSSPSPAYNAWARKVSEKFTELYHTESETLAPIIVASYYKLFDISIYLLNAGANPNTCNAESRTPLHFCSAQGNEKITQLLLEKGAIVNSRDQYGRTPLSLAAEFGHAGVIGALLTAKGDVKSGNDGRTPLSWAMEKGHEKSVQALLEQVGVDVNNKDGTGPTPLLWAMDNQYVSLVEKLIKTERVDMNTKDGHGRTLLFWAVENNSEILVRMLLEIGMDVDGGSDRLSQVLTWAAASGSEKVARILLRKGAKINMRDTEYGQTPLSWAAESGHERVVKLLLAEGAEVDARDTEYGRTPLSWAAENGHAEVVQILLSQRGVNVNSKENESGQTPLSSAAESGHEDVVKLLLLVKGVNRVTKDNSGRTPLSWAAEGGFVPVVKMLLEGNRAGNEVDSKDTEYGRTALAWASRNGHEEVVRMLLENGGVDVNSNDRTGRTPMSHARLTVVRELLEYNGVIDSGERLSGSENGEGNESDEGSEVELSSDSDYYGGDL